MSQMALRRSEDRIKALGGAVDRLLLVDDARRQLAAEMSGLGVHYDLGEGHPLLGRRMPDLDVVTDDGPLRIYPLLHDAQAVLLNLGPSPLDVAPWAKRLRSIDAAYAGPWELPALGAVAAPEAVLIRPDGYVAWVGEGSDAGLREALTKWCGA
jgi:3-(3-hydroxy-phenyl)propionate hydroxylase